MKRLIICLLCIMVSLLLTVSCTGHNSVMYEHLSNRDNYGTYQARVVDMYVYDQESKTYYRDYQSEMFLKGKVVFEVCFETYKDVETFLGSTPNESLPLSDYTFQLHVTPENNMILAEQGFYEDFSVGNTVQICSSHFIYMDTNYFYIAGLQYADTEYLSPDVGLENIIDMMKKDWSLT